MTSMTSYSAYNLMQVIGDEPHAVRDEAAKRHEAIAKKIAAAKARLAKMEREASEYGDIFLSAIKKISA